ncbi:MAG: Uma2 family endonuclease [Candidatus Eremiobacteraeota bacterium]|nr:Uma2 family endonuclease [Candidatus Eremiobacteraeota bacterium]
MSLPAENTKEKFTYGDYYSWDDGLRWELIDGVPFNMTPAPGVPHQRMLIELARQFATYFLQKECQVFIAPLDVRIPLHDERDEDITTVVQPDLIVVCDKEKIDERGVRGAPDLVIEIQSPSTARRDLKEKLALYERSGVKEYWIVQPSEKLVMVFIQKEKEGFSKPSVYAPEEKAPVGITDGGFEVELAMVFSEPSEKGESLPEKTEAPL